jgi:hypothetical protein
MKHMDTQQIADRLRELEQVVLRMAELQTRQIDREKNVPGSDPAELQVIDADLAAARALTHRLAEFLKH